jgi:hypothetical protein
MTRPSPSTPGAEDYLLGRLTRAERRQFEARLEQCAELRTQMRELEEGLVVLALAAPQCIAPRAAWKNIETAIARPAPWHGWLPWAGLKWFANSRGVAAGLTAVLIVHLLWQRPATPSTTSALEAAAKNCLRTSPPQYSSAAAVTRVETGTPPVFQTDKSRRKTTGFENPTPRFPQPQPPGPKQTAPIAAATLETDGGWQQVDFVDLTTPADASLSGLAAVPMGPTLAAGEMPPHNNLDPTGDAGSANTVAGSAVPLMSSPPYVFALLDPGVLSPDMNPITFWQPGEGGLLFPSVVPWGTNTTIVALPADGRPIVITGGISNRIIGQFPP